MTPFRRLLLAALLGLAALPALAGVGVASLQLLPSPDGGLHSAFPAGDAPPSVIELDWDIANELQTAGIEDMAVGVAFSHDVRQYLEGTDAPTATITVVDDSGDAAPFADPGAGDDLVYDEVTEGSGGLRLLATGSTGSTLSAIKQWTAVGDAPPPPGTVTKVVQPDGAGGAFTTIQSALSNAVAGDLIELRSNTPGTLTTRTESLETVGKNGTAALPIIIRVRSGDRYLIKNNAAAPIWLCQNSSYIQWDGNGSGTWAEDESEATASTRRDQLVFGDQSTWDPTTGGMAGPHTNTIRSENCHNIKVSKAKIHGGGTQTKGNFLRRDSSRWWFYDFEMSGHGKPDNGDLIDTYASQVKLEKGTMRWGGHDALSASGPYMVVRYLTVDGTWEDADASYAGLGSRVLGMTGMSHDGWSPTKGGNQHVGIVTDNTWDFGPQLLEMSRVKNVFPSIPGNAEPATKMQAFRVIERGNFFHDLTDSHIWIGPAYGNATVYAGDGEFPGPSQTRGYAYHNTGYDTEGVWVNANTNFNAALHQDNEAEDFRFVNNIFADLHNNPQAARSVVYWKKGTVPQNGKANFWKGTLWRSNIFQGDAARMNAELDDVEKPICAANPCAGGSAENFWPDNWQANFKQTAALSWVSIAARTRAGMTVSSGIGLADAAHLATTTATCSGTAVTVDDNRYFYDPENTATWDMADMDEENDYIAIGANLTAAALNIHQIETINANGTGIVLKTSATCASGDKVWFAGNPSHVEGQRLWDNRGAGQ